MIVIRMKIRITTMEWRRGEYCDTDSEFLVFSGILVLVLVCISSLVGFSTF
jgi:hypothetical protein